MTLAAMRLVVARLLTDRAYQRRFFAASPAQAGEHGLTAEEFGALHRLDPRSLGITTEGYSGKRLERVESAYPRTLRALEALEPGARWRYLQGTSFPPGDAEERAAFHAHVRSGGAGGARGAEAQRFLDPYGMATHGFGAEELRATLAEAGAGDLLVAGKVVLLNFLPEPTIAAYLSDPRHRERLLALESALARDPAMAGLGGHLHAVGRKA